MTKADEVLIPLINPNEPEVQIVEILVQDGSKVKSGDVLCIVETTKSTNEIVAESGGYVVAMDVSQGDKLRSGDRLCWLAKAKDWTPPSSTDAQDLEKSEGLPSDLRITKPALTLAQESGLSLERLPLGSLVTEAVVRRVIEEEGGSVVAEHETPLDTSALVIYGGGGHGKALIDMVRAIESFQIVGIIDDGITAGTQIMGVEVLGGAEQLSQLAQKGVRQAINAVGGIGDLGSRIRVFQRLQSQGFAFPTLVHPTAWVEPGAELGEGVQIFPHAYVGSEVRLGMGVIVNTGAIVSHDCILGDYVNVAPGAILAGNVSIGEGVLVGMGVTINLNAKVGQGAKLGNSAVVKTDVPDGQLVRAGTIWPTD